MIGIQKFILVSGLQVLLFSAVLLVAVVVIKRLLKRRAGRLIACGMTVIALLCLAAALPIPGWFDGSPTTTTDEAPNQLARQQRTESNPAVSADDDSLTEVAPSNGESQWSFSGYMNELREQLRQTSAIEPVTDAAKRPWTFWLLVLGVAAISVGLVRFAIAIAGVVSLHRHGLPITERRPHEMLQAVCARMDCSRKIFLVEIEDANAPFTVGWWNHRIFLPREYREWSDRQLEAILSHEIAHVQNGDFLQRLLAQFTVAINFYNPLVHWLSRQLMVEQELQADDLAAETVGGRKSYLKTLARLALENDCPKNRLVPLFLPTRKSFFRRIEMLRTQKHVGKNSRWTSGFAVGLILTLGVAVAGLRLPQTATADQPSTAENPLHALPLDDARLQFVANDSDIVVVVRPSVVFSLMDNLVGQLDLGDDGPKELANWKSQFRKNYGIAADATDQLTFVFDSINSRENTATVIIRAKQDVDWLSADSLDEQMKTRLNATPAGSFRDLKLFEISPEKRQGSLVCAPNSRTLVICQSGPRADNAAKRAMKAALRSGRESKNTEWFASWSTNAKRPVSVYYSSEAIDSFASQFGRKSANPIASLLVPLWEEPDFVTGGLELSGKLELELQVRCGSSAGSAAVSKTAQALIPIAKAMAKQWSRNSQNPLSDPSREPSKPQSEEVVGLLNDALDSAQITTSDTNVNLKLGLEGDTEKQLKQLANLFLTARAASRQISSANNMRQIALAMLNYESAHGHLPTPVLISESGKKYSWRVALLPYLEQQKLYDQYRFDEEWNSEHNSKITKTIPSTYLSPMSSEPWCSYFLVTGPETPFGGKAALLRDISDGMSNTIFVVESNMKIHWAEPRDIPYQPKGMIKKMGGISKTGFHVTLGDGSVRFLPNSFDSDAFQALLTKSGNELIDLSRSKE